MLLQLLINGIVLGSIIALAAIGLSMIYGILNFANFAHGDFLTLGAYLAFLFSVVLGINFMVACVFSVIITAVVGVGCDYVIWKPMRSKGAGRVALIIISIGLALFIRNLIIFLWGSDIERYALPVKRGIEIGTVVITQNQLIEISIALLCMFLVHYLLKSTTVGKAMRALSDNIDLARVSGIDVDLMIRYTWAIGMALAGVSGILYGLLTNINPNMGWFMLLPMFAAAILGGIGNPYGAMAGGILIGVAQELSTAILPPEYKLAVAFAIMIVVLLLRPQGIMG
ncbi:MAG: branched-chain amino acid ABC transporter permease [Methanophagales archaeon]|nr:branched-chain amino acid ABC transporter permease [Methanophagales archaeon]MCW3138360.1 branched-chain amino acid ABC transporter permease [Methanophagales archaeon]MCW7069524.1 branched-chain amino acid ABC transporter permease [Methanophagales archaeon]MCW7074165.1 branched-chain amino acid ABC transporter permease [Methanophagales archaeon]RLG35679.1 MAG: branched-chain amino acid ABC transporter permease [Methanosarcinales archaeon]